MTDMLAPGAPAVPVLVACGACGNLEDLLVVLSSSFGLTALLALGQYVLDRARRFLGLRRDRRTDTAEAAACFRIVAGGSDGPDLTHHQETRTTPS
jgi:hypothetical protein